MSNIIIVFEFTINNISLIEHYSAHAQSLKTNLKKIKKDFLKLLKNVLKQEKLSGP